MEPCPCTTLCNWALTVKGVGWPANVADLIRCPGWGRVAEPDPQSQLRPAMPHGDRHHRHGDWATRNDKCPHLVCEHNGGAVLWNLRYPDGSIRWPEGSTSERAVRRRAEKVPGVVVVKAVMVIDGTPQWFPADPVIPPGACRDCGEPFVPVQRGECSRCGSDGGDRD